MRAEVISIGSELVTGQSLDTNSQWISQRLAAYGIQARFHSTVGDDLADNLSLFRLAASRSELVLVSGGLGPTQDDLTREVLSTVAGVSLVEDKASLAIIEAFFSRRKREMKPANKVQALFPEGAEPLPNPIGTAPGIWLGIGKSYFACMPGVPKEMHLMCMNEVLPRVAKLESESTAPKKVIVYRKINLFGRGESDVEADALDLTARGRQPEVGITVNEATISFRVTGIGASEVEAQASCEPTLAIIRKRFGDLVLGEGSEDVAEALFAELKRTGKRLATAESCTGGLAAHLMTEIPGVSDYYSGGVVSYSNELKEELLGVSSETLQRFGAVSAEVAEAMALGALLRLHADIAVSVTGVAGPSGGSETKPVGLVYIGLASAKGVSSRRLDLGSDQPRSVIQIRSAKFALNGARLELLKW